VCLATSVAIDNVTLIHCRVWRKEIKAIIETVREIIIDIHIQWGL
jgi:hypothetical protein